MIRSKISNTPAGSTSRPVSSRTSRQTASSRLSPSSSTPPGSDHQPFSGSLPRCASRTRSRSEDDARRRRGAGRFGYRRVVARTINTRPSLPAARGRLDGPRRDEERLANRRRRRRSWQAVSAARWCVSELALGAVDDDRRSPRRRGCPSRPCGCRRARRRISETNTRSFEASPFWSRS